MLRNIFSIGEEIPPLYPFNELLNFVLPLFLACWPKSFPFQLWDLTSIRSVKLQLIDQHPSVQIDLGAPRELHVINLFDRSTFNTNTQQAQNA